jgi:hypothetical protein
MRTLNLILLLILCNQLISQNFSQKKVIIDNLLPTTSSSGTIITEEMIYCTSFEPGQVNFISHLMGKLDIYDYTNSVLSKVSQGIPLSTFIVDFIDQNLDGKTDIVGNYDVLLSNGNYSFTNDGYPIKGNWNKRAKRIFDINKDGNYDIISSTFTSPSLDIFYLDKSRNSVTEKKFPETGLIEAVVLGDINKDGLIDLIYTTKKFGDDKLVIQTNQNNNTFSRKEIKVSSTGEQLVLGDLDNNGFLDIIITGFSGTDLIWCKNTNGTFSEKSTILDTETIFTIKVDDLDKDSNLDIIYLENLNSGSINIMTLKGLGNGTFEPKKIIGNVAFKGAISSQSAQAYENWFSIFDYDKDGDKDILVNAIFEKQFVSFDNLLITSSNEEINELNNLQIYPNPVDQFLQIQNIVEYKSVEIIDINGKIVKKINNISDNKIYVDNLNSGIYILRLLNNDRHFISKRFIKY